MAKELHRYAFLHTVFCDLGARNGRTNHREVVIVCGSLTTIDCSHIARRTTCVHSLKKSESINVHSNWTWESFSCRPESRRKKSTRYRSINPFRNCICNISVKSSNYFVDEVAPPTLLKYAESKEKKEEPEPAYSSDTVLYPI